MPKLFMKTWKSVPNNPHVAKFIDCYWYLEKEPSDTGDNYPKLYPDPAGHLILAHANLTLNYAQDIKQEGKGSHWIYPHRQTFTMDHSHSFQIIGIKFKTGALYSVLDGQAASILDRIEQFDGFTQISSTNLNSEQLLLNAGDHPLQICQQLDDDLAPILASIQVDKHGELVTRILPLLNKTAITQIGHVLHKSQRTIERSFLRVTGLTLKQCQSMIRLEEILDHLYKLKAQEINWGDLAVQFDFSDQPHLIRHLKNAIGKTPTEYAQKRDLTIDIYGDFEVL